MWNIIHYKIKGSLVHVAPACVGFGERSITMNIVILEDNCRELILLNRCVLISCNYDHQSSNNVTEQTLFVAFMDR
jgi:hypothetical protein